MTRRVLWIGLGLWALAFAASFIVTGLTDPTGDGFTRGLNRVTTFLGWQVAAGLIGIVLWVVGNGLDKGTWPRRLSRAPALVFGLLVAAIVGLILYANLSRPAPVQVPPAKPPTAQPAEPTVPVQ
ncbi:hypothetical protein [Maritimibacter fusiformis]|uniref:Uncharacterized protein n=1 Tax=Maritimibacter fusiformis TaxID=2603819 RepID=A0A5D0RNY5_9RHOB|nr:hypothetical protein [Maritimibacter fusiformis]TYB82294.1 hypothetical protein FVF75_06110 [Maritimibacter fusiformis]